MNIIYKTNDISNEEYLNCFKLWNDEMGKIYPILESNIYYNVIDYSLKKAMIAYIDNKIVGFIILKEFHDDYLENYNDMFFISIIYVSKKYRHQGIGTTFVNFALNEGKDKDIWLGKDIHNFFPAIPNDFDNLTDNFFQSKGFTTSMYTHDLVRHNPTKYSLKNTDVIYTFLDVKRKDEIIDFLKENNWKRWVYEAIDYFNRNKINNNYLVGLKDNKVISFAVVNTKENNFNSYNMMWRGRFENLAAIGPLGVDKSLRKTGLGYDIVAASINSLVDYGASDIMIDWTGLMEFYQKFDFEVWKSYRYTYKERSRNE